MAKNRELSQFGSFVVVNDTNGNIGIATTATPSVGIGTTNPQAKLHVVPDAIIGELKVTSAGIVTSANPGVCWLILATLVIPSVTIPAAAAILNGNGTVANAFEAAI